MITVPELRANQVKELKSYYKSQQDHGKAYPKVTVILRSIRG